MAKYYITACEAFYDNVDVPCIRRHLAKIQSICPEFVQAYMESTLPHKKRRDYGVTTINCLVYGIVNGDTISRPVKLIQNCLYDESEMKSCLGSAYVTRETFNWYIDYESDTITSSDENVSKHNQLDSNGIQEEIVAQKNSTISASGVNNISQSSDSVQGEFTGYKSTLEDIDLEFRSFPVRDVSKLWDTCYDDCGREMKVYYSHPIIPTKQNEITITTPYDQISDMDLLKLFPDHFIRTRLDIMYEPQEGFTVHPKLGFIPKISGFTEEQVIDNIIKYPRFCHIFRMIDDPDRFRGEKRISFISRIEVDGELLRLKEAINTVEDMKNLPDINVFYYDYIMRRYLLERDYHTLEHKYPLDGYLQPFTVLFMTPEEYAELGYTDALDLAKQCVKHRVQFYQSIHPLTKVRFSSEQTPIPESIEKRDCIFAETCNKVRCDYTCGQDVMYNYIWKKSGIRKIEDRYDESQLIEDFNMLSKYAGDLVCIETPDVIKKTSEYTYIYACKLRGVNANLVHISYSAYIQQIRDSWTYGGTEELEHLQLRLRKWTVAIISGIDYCMFKDFEAQTLLNIIDTRRLAGLTTIILTRSLTNIHGNSIFLSPLKEQLKEVLVYDRIH